MPDKPDNHDSTDKSATDDAGKGKGLAALLKEYEEGLEAKADSGKKGKSTDELAAMRKELDELRAAEADRSYRKEMDDFMIPTVRGDLKIPNVVVESWLNDQANRDPRLQEIWQKRGDDRAAFEKTVKALTEDFAKFAKAEGLSGDGKGDGKGSGGKGADRDPSKSLAAAIRSSRQSSSGSDDLNNVNLGGMTDNEFALHKAEVFRLQAAGQLN